VKLLDDLFQIVDNEIAESGFSTTIKLFSDHVIYAGHFPGHPVTPGVVQMQIVHELVENHLGRKLELVSVDECKFLKIINPEEQDEIQISVLYATDSSLLQVKASGKFETDTFFKFKGSYKII